MNSKINGKFYPLKHSEWLIACRELTPSKRDVLYYLRTLDPYGDGVEINCAEIARQLSSERRNISRQTVSRAIKELDAKGFIDAEISRANVTIKPKGLWCAQTPSVREDTKGVPRHHRCVRTPQGVPRHHKVCPDTIRSLKRPNSKTSSSLRLIQTLKTLSQTARERKIRFLKKRKSLGQRKPATISATAILLLRHLHPILWSKTKISDWIRKGSQITP